MSHASVPKTRAQGTHHSMACRRVAWLVLLGGPVILAGCARVAPQQQRLVSKPNMQFADSLVFSYQDKLLTQIEPGSAAFAGAGSAGCGSCGE